MSRRYQPADRHGRQRYSLTIYARRRAEARLQCRATRPLCAQHVERALDKPDRNRGKPTHVSSVTSRYNKGFGLSDSNRQSADMEPCRNYGVTLTLRIEHRCGPIAASKAEPPALQKQRGAGWGRNAQYQEAERVYCLQWVKRGHQQEMPQPNEWLARLGFRNHMI